MVVRCGRWWRRVPGVSGVSVVFPVVVDGSGGAGGVVVVVAVVMLFRREDAMNMLVLVSWCYFVQYWVLF